MFATPNITQLHVPKTAGTWLRMYMAGQPEPKTFKGHWPGQLTEEDGYLNGREVWATVRDPETFYPSLWMHAEAYPPNRPSSAAWGQGSGAFGDVLYGWTHSREVEPIPEPYGAGVFTPLMDDWLEVMREHNMGLCSFLHAYVLSPWGVLREKGVHVPSWYPDRYFFLEDLKKLHPHGPVNTAEERPGDPIPRPVLTDEHRAWIAEADGAFIEGLKHVSHG